MEDTSMNQYPARYRWAIALIVIALTITAGVVAYNIGLSQGLAQVAEATAQQGASPPPAPSAFPPPYYYGYGWHRPWGGGFIFPMLFLFWILLFAVARGGFWRHGYYGRPYFAPYEDRFDEMHRRAHDRMNKTE
jgi:hypothetical protein